MNRKNKLLALLGVLAALCVMTFAAGKLNAPVDTTSDDNAADENEAADETVVAAEISADNVAGFTFTSGESTLALSRTDGEWLAPQDLDFPVDADKVADTLEALAKVTATQKLDAPDSLETYGLSEPDETLTVSLADGTTTTFAFGDTNSLTGDLYALVDGDVYTLDASFADGFTTELYDYVKLEALPTVESVASLTVEQGMEYAFSLYRTEEAAGLTWQKDAVWCFEKNGETRVVDTSKAETLMDTLSTLSWKSCVNAHASDADLDAYGLTDADALHAALTYIDENGDVQTLYLLVGMDAVSGTYARLEGSTQVYTISTDTADGLRYATYASLRTDALLPLDMDAISGFAVTLSGETTEITVTETVATADETEEDSAAEPTVAKGYTTGETTLDSAKVQKLLSALTSLKQSGATVDPDLARPLIALTFHRESGDVSLTLYAFDAENVLADVNGEIGLLIEREDAENIVDLALEMLEAE